MKHLFKPFSPADPLEDAGNSGQSTNPTLPIGVAALVCLICFALVYFSSKSLVDRLGVWWAEFLIYAVVPITVTFSLLHRSHWHREMTRARRSSYLILFSFLILCSCLLFLAFLIPLFSIFVGLSRVGPG